MSKRKYSDESFTEAVRVSTSVRQVLMVLGLRGAGGNYALAKKRISELGLDSSHFTGMGHLKGKKHTWAKKIPLSEILVENSSYTCSNKLRIRLLNEGGWKAECTSCHRTTWLDKPIPLELDHVNGISNDNRKENLRMLCPNCHAFTPTHRGKNIGHGKKGV